MKSTFVCTLCLFCFVSSSFGQSAPQSLENLDMPHYPPIARVARVQGQVKATIEVAPSGAVTSVKVSGQQEILNEYVLKNIATWRFSGTLKPRSVEATVIYEFRITGTSDQPLNRVTFDRDRVLIETNPPVVNTSQITTQ